MSTSVGTMSLNDIIHVHSCFLLQVVDVLCSILPQNTLVLEHLDKEMCRCRIVLRQIKVLSETVERLRLVEEKINGEDAFWLRQVVLF